VTTEIDHLEGAPWRRHPAFERPPPPLDLIGRAADAGWPDHLIPRAAALRVDRAAVESWLDHGFPVPAQIDEWLTAEEELVRSTLKLRVATWFDHDLLADLFANSPETVGQWQVTVERSPNPFAAFRLQEESYVIVLEDQRVGLGAVAHSCRNTLIGGTEASVHVISAWRVRDGLRGLGISNRLLMAPGSGTSRFGGITYWYVRNGNTSRAWIDHVVDDMAHRPDAWSTEVSGLTATVHYLPATASAERDARVRPATAEDLPACVELVNRTHHGLDLFRPYTPEHLRNRLDDGSWGPKPWFAIPVYGWDDYLVLEADGRVVACAGLWDRGADVRERWRSAEHGTEQVFDPGAVLDFGFAQGHDDDLRALIGHCLACCAERSRSGLLVPLEFLPEVLEGCARYEPVPDTRTLEVMPFRSPQLTIDLPVTRPYTDLAYW
jgi:hypothetical protein